MIWAVFEGIMLVLCIVTAIGLVYDHLTDERSSESDRCSVCGHARSEHSEYFRTTADNEQ